MYLFKVTWEVMSPYTQKIETGHDFYIAKNEKEVNEFKQQQLIKAGCTQVSVHSKYISCFVLIEGSITTISELGRVGGLILEEELKRIDDFFDSLTEEEFEDIAEQAGLYDDK